jgi:hypothetical protein
MRREDGMVQMRGSAPTDRTSLRRLTKREIDRRIEAIGAEVARAFEGEESERIEYLGEEIFPRPMDTKVFVKIMSRHLVFN